MKNTELDDSQILDIIEQLHGDSAQSETILSLNNCTPPNYLLISANRAGYFRLAASFLQAAISEPSLSAQPQIRNLSNVSFIPNSEFFLAGLLHKEDWENEMKLNHDQTRKWHRRDRLALAGCGIISFIMIMILYLASIGFMSLIR